MYADRGVAPNPLRVPIAELNAELCSDGPVPVVVPVSTRQVRSN